MSTNESYWEEFYKTFQVQSPSQFASWASPRITGNMVFDIGCGNGRDTELLRREHRVMGIDPQAPLDTIYARWTAQQFLRFTSPLPTDTLYMRWFLHAVPEDIEDQILRWCRGQILAEVRIVGDELDPSHYRRPIVPEDFIMKLFRYGYDLKYLETSRDFSPLDGPDPNPLLMRVEAHRRA